MKKHFTLLVLFCLCTLAVWAYESDQFQVGQLIYSITSNNTVEVTYSGDYFEKSEYDEELGEEYIYGYGIGNNYPKLTSVTIPSNVSYKGVSYRVTAIGDDAFYGCKRLTYVSIPSTVKKIGYQSFYGCKSLSSLTLPNQITEIASYAFYDCTSLMTIEIPSSIKWIGIDVFVNTPIYNKLPDGPVYIYNILYEYKGTMPANTKFSVQKGTVRINGYAFYDCASLVSISIPTSVKEIEAGAFVGCTSLTKIYYGGTKAQWHMISKSEEMDSWEPEQTYAVYCTDGVVYGNDF